MQTHPKTLQGRKAFDAEKGPTSGIVNYDCIAIYVPFETCRVCMG